MYTSNKMIHQKYNTIINLHDRTVMGESHQTMFYSDMEYVQCVIGMKCMCAVNHTPLWLRKYVSDMGNYCCYGM